MNRGKLIVIDGIDGSGKATQSELLKKRLRQEGVKVKTIDFPRYYNNFFGHLIGEYLSGEYGDFVKTDPRVASVLYAADRFESSGQIKKWLKEGYIVVADRYISANQIHQGGKIDKAQKRRKFLEWLEQMEYGVFGIPRPNLVVFLDVPFDISQLWVKQKINQRSKNYLKGRRDVAEDNLEHLKNSRQVGLSLARKHNNWEKIECCDNQVCMTPEQVHEEVIKIVRKRLKLKLSS